MKDGAPCGAYLAMANPTAKHLTPRNGVKIIPRATNGAFVPEA